MIIMKYAFAIISIIFLVLFIRNVAMLIFSLENYNIHKKRLNQLQKTKQPKKDDVELTGLIDQITKPVIDLVFSRLKPKKLEIIEQQLKLAKWDKMMTPIQYRALDLVLKFFGVIVGLIFATKGVILGIIVFLVFFFLLPVGLHNGYSERKKLLLNDFPDFISITEGYLSSGMTFSEAVLRAMPYVGKEWQPILKQFSIDSEIHGAKVALDNLKNTVDIFEVREFAALVRLTLDQGGEMAESFRAQAERMREVKRVILMRKIAGRQAMGVFIQMPLMLTDFVIFGLPTFTNIIGLTSGKM
ncbi:type II secretion system F family protein [Lysinibacillus sp. UGB7]|uniref:type II secretion system F family protein n=1 Tax=Lysinibacillus sp. UGB7 TaxID=3411039 RepID=UPI003B7A2978